MCILELERLWAEEPMLKPLELSFPAEDRAKHVGTRVSEQKKYFEHQFKEYYL